MLYCHRKFDQTNIRCLWSCWLEGSTTCPTSLRDILGYTTIVNNKVCVFEFVEPRWHRNSDPWGPALAADNAEVKNLRAFLTFHTRKRFLLGIEPTNTMARSGRSTNCNLVGIVLYCDQTKNIYLVNICNIYIYTKYIYIFKSARTKAAPHPFGSLGHPTGVHSHYEYRPGGRYLLTSNIMSSARTLDKNKISNRRESNSWSTPLVQPLPTLARECTLGKNK